MLKSATRPILFGTRWGPWPHALLGDVILGERQAWLPRATSDSVQHEGIDLATLGDEAMAIVWRQRIDFVFKRCNLVPEFSLVENVAAGAAS